MFITIDIARSKSFRFLDLANACAKKDRTDSCVIKSNFNLNQIRELFHLDTGQKTTTTTTLSLMSK